MLQLLGPHEGLLLMVPTAIVLASARRAVVKESCEAAKGVESRVLETRERDLTEATRARARPEAAPRKG